MHLIQCQRTKVRPRRHGVYSQQHTCLRACQRAAQPNLQVVAGRGRSTQQQGTNALQKLSKRERLPKRRTKKEREKAIVDKEKEAADLKKKYFGPEGELYKKRQSLIEPIQDEIYNAVKSIATTKGFQLILDRASDNGIIFASPSIDISNEVLSKLGYDVR